MFENNEATKPLVTLIIMDGLGVHPDPLGNAVLQSKTPFLDTVWTNSKSCLIQASGKYVGLPEFEPGNSEVGHLSIGTGQVSYQSLSRINDAISNGEFENLDEIKKTFEEVKKRNSKMHLLGILTSAGVHGNIQHLFALLDCAKKYNVDPLIHIMLDGRDSGPTDGYFYISKLVQKIKEIGVGRIATIQGRLYGMDRDNRWERTQLAYECLVGVAKRTTKDVFALVQEAYASGEDDQIFSPSIVVDEGNNPVGEIADNDVVLFYNYREDRARQLTKSFVIDSFDSFNRVKVLKNIYFATMTGYSEDLPTHIIFPPKKITNTLASIISDAGLKQLHISETEKFMHITYFLNGGIEKPHKGEEFFNIPSPKVFEYSKVPEMSSYIIRDEVLFRLNKIKDNDFSLVVINFANPDMVGHTGNLKSAIKACEVVDECVRDVVTKTIELGGAAVIIADHGNCETMIDRDTKKIDIAHTNNPVPFIFVSNKKELQTPKKVEKLGTGRKSYVRGILADITPTILSYLRIPKGKEMTGVNLLELFNDENK